MMRGESMKYFENNKAILYKQDNLELMRSLEDESIDLIYCDILYGTGRNFGDYQDLKANKNVIDEHYISRIKEMYRLLKDTGSIYIHCDWRINHWIRLILDEVFGYDNFVNEIIWKYGLGGSGKREFAKKHDTIMFYSRSSKYVYNLQYENATSNKLKGQQKKMTDVWDVPNINNMAKERIGYSTQKPRELLERIIKASSNENDVVADFYMGSGTTSEVAVELGRKFIGCDINERACEITKNRILKINTQ
jgi:DNA modification methylase